MAINWQQMLGSSLGSAAKDLGYTDLYQQSLLRKPNGPPTGILLPSQQAHQDVMQGIQTGLNQPVQHEDAPINAMGMFQNRVPVHMYASGGQLDPNSINIVGEHGPEVIVGNQKVVPLQRPQERQRPFMADAPLDGQPTDNLTTPAQDALMSQAVNGTQETDPMDAIYGRMQQALKPSPWKDLGVGLVQGANNFFNHQNNPIKTYGELKLERQHIPQQLGILQQQRAAKIASANAQAEQELKRSQADYWAGRNPTALATLQERQQGMALGRLTKLKYFDPTNSVHMALAKDAGVDTSDLKGWDDRNPITKQVAGVTYSLNRQTGAYEPTNLPVDESKTVTNYDVTMPDGEHRTYKVAQRDAASFSTQMSALGARLAQQDKEFTQKMALDTAKFNQAKSQWQQMFTLRQQAENRLVQAQAVNDAQAVLKAQKDLADYNAKLQSMKILLETRHKNQELSDDQYNELNSFFDQ